MQLRMWLNAGKHQLRKARNRLTGRKGEEDEVSVNIAGKCCRVILAA